MPDNLTNSTLSNPSIRRRSIAPNPVDYSQFLSMLYDDIDFAIKEWTAKYGDKASRIEIVYYPEDDGFDIISNEANNGILPRNRISAFRGELMAWASQQTQFLKGWADERVVTAFAVIHKDGQFGALCQTADANATVSDTSAATLESETNTDA